MTKKDKAKELTDTYLGRPGLKNAARYMILLFLSYNAIHDHMSVNLCDPPFCTAYFFMTLPLQGLKKL